MKRLLYLLVLALPMLLTAQQADEKSNQNKPFGVSKERHEVEGLKLYPNPVINNVVYVSTKKKTAKNITVFDVFGKVVLKKKLMSRSLDTSKLSKGVYIMQINQENSTSTRKLVIK